MGSSRRRWIGVLVVLGLGLTALSFWAGDPPGCSSRVVREAVSPDGRLRAVQRVGACVLTGEAYRLEIKSPFRFGTEVFRHPNEFDFCWKSAGELVVESLPAPFMMKHEARGVRIVFGGMQECGVEAQR